MKTVKLDEIVCQKDPELKQTIEHLAHGQVGEAIAGLERKGRIYEVKGSKRADRGHLKGVCPVAREHAGGLARQSFPHGDQPCDSRRVASPVESSARRSIGPKCWCRARILPGADRMWAARYNAGDVLLYSRSSQETGIA